MELEDSGTWNLGEGRTGACCCGREKTRGLETKYQTVSRLGETKAEGGQHCWGGGRKKPKDHTCWGQTGVKLTRGRDHFTKNCPATKHSQTKNLPDECDPKSRRDHQRKGLSNRQNKKTWTQNDVPGPLRMGAVGKCEGGVFKKGGGPSGTSFSMTGDGKKRLVKQGGRIRK